MSRCSFIFAFAVIITAFAAACGGEENPEKDPASQSVRPLQPLVYTERPDLSPEAAAVREERLMRQLLEGSHASGSWGMLDSEETFDGDQLTDAEALGEALFEALIERDEAQWDAIFIGPDAYASGTGVGADEARHFVDDIQGDSRALWRSFEPARASEAPSGGLGEVFEFAELDLGSVRETDGFTEHRDNTLELRLRDHEVTFELAIPTIVRLAGDDGAPRAGRLALASPVQTSQKLSTYLDAGLHLKEELLEVREYPYPMAVGNFWRYRRQPAELVDGGLEPLDDDDEEADIGADETLQEVTDVDRLDSMWLVRLRRTYEDEDLTTLVHHRLLTPRRIYRCDDDCREEIEDLDWLLEYMAEETPLFRFPLRLDQGWTRGGHLTEEGAQFSTEPDWRDVEAPAGNFANTVVVRGIGPLAHIDPYIKGRSQRRFFSHGRGMVRREVAGEGDEESTPVIEELVETRLMPR